MGNNLLAVKIGDRKEFAPSVQEVLTRYGDIIKMRIGLNENIEEGIIILNLTNDDRKIDDLIFEIEKIKTVQVKNIKF